MLAGCGRDDTVEEPTSSPTVEVTSTQPTEEPTTTPGSIPTEPAPRLFNADTPPGDYEMAIGQTSALRLAPDGPIPVVEGTSVLLIEVAFFEDPGYREWELRAVDVGTTSIQLDEGEATTFRLVVTD